MYQVDEKPETIHLYVVREGKSARPPLAPLLLSLFGLALLIVLSVAFPYKQPVTRLAIRVPAVPLGVKSFTVSVAILPTGIRTYPATTAHGVLTITNGSIIAQVIPAGFTIGGVVTDATVYVPAGSADGYGQAAVSAHALTSGHAGNLAPLAINAVIGSSVYVRNLSAFQGGRDAYAVKYVTDQDRHKAIAQARHLLTGTVTGLHYPCVEAVTGSVTLTWRCQFVTYSLPSSMHVVSVQLQGKEVVVTVWFVAHPTRVWVK